MHYVLAHVLTTDTYSASGCLPLFSISLWSTYSMSPAVRNSFFQMCFPPPRKQHTLRGGLHDLPLQHFNMPRHSGGLAASTQPSQQPRFLPFQLPPGPFLE